MKKLYLTVMLIILSLLTNLSCSETTIDSLLKILNHEKGIPRADILNMLSREYLQSNPVKSIRLAEEALAIARTEKNQLLIEDSMNNIASGYYFLSDYENALKWYDNSLDASLGSDNTSNIARAYNNLGLVFNKLNFPDKALEYYLMSLDLEEKQQNGQGIAMSLCNLGNFHYQRGSLEKALEYFQQSLAIQEQLSLDEGLADVLNNIGIVYDELKKYDIALEYYLRSLELEKKLGNQNGIATTANNIGLVYQNLNIIDEAKNYLELSLDITTEIGEKYGIANTKMNLGNLYLKMNELDQAQELIYTGLELAKFIKAPDLIMTGYELLAEFYAAKKDFQAAYENQNLFIKEKLAIIEASNNERIQTVATRFEMEKKNREINSLKMSRQIILRNSFMLAFVLILILALLIYNRNRFKNKLIREMGEVNEKLQEIARTDHLTNLSNRRAMVEKIEYEKIRFERSSNPFVIIIADIDDFKLINDEFGHECGDYVLKALSNLMVDNSRRQDVIGRWGGEEFIMLLPETKLDGGIKLAEKIRQIIKDKTFFYKGNNHYITATFGVSQHDPSSSIEQTIREADEALYSGKRKGKNCVVSYPEI